MIRKRRLAYWLIQPYQQFKHEHKRNWKTKQVTIPGEWDKQNMEIEDKGCASYNWSIKNNYKGIRSEPPAATSKPVSHKPTGGHTNQQCPHHS